MQRSSVSKLHFPDPGFNHLWSDRRQRVSSTHGAPSRSPSKPLQDNISFRKSILQSTACPIASGADSSAARNLSAPLSRSKSV
jgi:hypothetical protein